MSLEILADAIRNKRVIRYTYDGTDEPVGFRTGHPYAVFIFTAKSGLSSTMVHIVQTEGVTKSKTPFPSFRQHKLDRLGNIEILEGITFGEPYHEDYNPEWEKYIDVIAKI